MFTFDFKSGYHHVDLFPKDRKYLKVATLQVHADLLKCGFLPNEAKGSHMHLGHYLTRCRSQPFHFWNFCHWQADYQFTKNLTLSESLATSSSCHSISSLPPFAVKSYLLAPALEMSLQSSIPRLPGTLTFVFRLKLSLSWIFGNLMRQVLTAYLFGLSDTNLRRSSIPIDMQWIQET